MRKAVIEVSGLSVRGARPGDSTPNHVWLMGYGIGFKPKSEHYLLTWVVWIAMLVYWGYRHKIYVAIAKDTEPHKTMSY